MYRLSSSPYVPNQLFVGQPPVDDMRQHKDEPSEVVKLFTEIATKRLLIQIPMQMERHDGYLRSLERSFQKAPEVL